MQVLKCFLLTAAILLPIAASQQEPTTPTPFHPKKTNANAAAKNAIPNAYTPDEPTDQSEPEKVLYVAPEDYDLELEKNEIQNTPVDSPKETERFIPSFNNIGSASELYRLLAIGPQQSDPGLSRFGDLFGRISTKSATSPNLDNIDHCPERPEIGIQYYCMQLEDGVYYDPWNPWCGFIRCSDGVAERVCCKQGTWLGMANLLKANQKSMCRRPLRSLQLIEDDRCPLPNTADLCRAAKKVEKMNPPKKREIALGQFSRYAKNALPALNEETIEPLVSASIQESDDANTEEDAVDTNESAVSSE